MKHDDQPDTATSKRRLIGPPIKTIVTGTAILVFFLLNIFILRNAASFVPSERTQRLIRFNLNPEFWPDWVAQILWMLAMGVVLATFLRLKSVQGWLENKAGMPFPFRIVGLPICFKFQWGQKLAEYPVERRILSLLPRLFQGFKWVLRPTHLPLLVLTLTLLWTGHFFFVNVMGMPSPFSLRNLLWPIAFTLWLPFMLCGWFVISPLHDLLINGTVSWRLFIAVAVPFALVMGGYLYGRKIKKFLLQDQVRPLLIRYSVFAAMIYAMLLPILSDFSRYVSSFFSDFVMMNWYQYFIWEPFYLYLNEGIISWRTAVLVLFFALAVCVPYFGFRRLYYAKNRKKSFRTAACVLAIPIFLFVYYFHMMVWFFLTNIWEGVLLIYRYVLKLPTQAWEGIYYAPCLFLYYSILSWQLLIGPVLLIVLILGYLFNPFRQLAGRIRFSEKILYALLWTLLLVSCFFVTVWKMLLLIGTISLAYYVAVRDFGMPKIRIVLSAKGQRIAYRILIGLLVTFDLFIGVVNVIVVYHCGEFFHSFFYKPFANLMSTGVPSWDLLGPIFVLISVLIFIGWLVLARFGTKSVDSRREPIQKLFLYGSLAVILVLMNFLCFIRLFTTEANIPWWDVRLWPWWGMILPISLIIFSVSGLLLTRKAKPVTLSILFLCCFAVLSDTLQAAENRLVLLEPAKFVSASEARQAAGAESMPSEDGFLANPTIVDCFAAMEYRYTGGRYENEPIKFRLRSPLAIEPGKKYPLIVWFHGRGESDNDNRRQLAHLQLAMEFFAGPNQQDFFMLATQCPGDNNQWTRSVSTEGKGDAPVTIACEIMEAVLREFPVDENRISGFGFSSGGTGSWEFGRQSPRRLAALGSCSGNPVREAKPEEYLGPAIWAFVNSGDAGVSSEDAVVFVEAINTGGGNAFLSLYEASGHDTWTRAMREEKIIGWLILQSLERPGPPQGVICRPPLTAMQQFSRFWLPVLVMIACALPLFLTRRKEVHP